MMLDDTAFTSDIQFWINENIKPNNKRWSATNQLPIRELVRSLFEKNLLVQGWPSPYGDGNIRKQLYLHYSLAKQSMGALGLCLASHIDIGARGLLEKGSCELIDQWLPNALNGNAIFSLAMTEPNAGSDLQGIQFSAHKCDAGWELNGIKRGITNLPFADASIVLARTHPNRSPLSYSLFLVPINTVGIIREEALPTLTYSGCLGGIKAESAVIPHSNLIGHFGAGLVLLMQHLETERLFVSARMLGTSEYLLNKITQLNTHCDSHALLNTAKLKVQLMAFQAYFELCITRYKAGTLGTKDSASLKYMGSRLLNIICDAFVAHSGAQSYMQGNSAMKYATEAMGLSLAGGSEEIMLSLIGNTL